MTHKIIALASCAMGAFWEKNPHCHTRKSVCKYTTQEAMGTTASVSVSAGSGSADGVVSGSADGVVSTLVVATINVQMMNHGGPRRVGRRVYNRLHRAHVICVQEDLVEPGLTIPHFDLAVRCVGEPIGDRGFLCNSIFVKRGLVVKDTAVVTLPSAEGRFVPRCALLCTVKGVRIANLHLTGGRYDDRQAHVAPDIKDLQVHRVLQLDPRRAPDIVVGDLNGQPGLLPPSAVAYQATLPSMAAKSFPAFFSGGHATLRNAGYQPVLSRTSEPHVTSVFGTSPDWIYVRPRPGLQSAGPSTRVNFTRTDSVVSDHDAVMARFILTKTHGREKSFKGKKK
jgi:endonuclease/exonuclease/phosphatase family metal-dependent hydrolase